MFRVYVSTNWEADTNPSTGEVILPAKSSWACVMETKDKKKALEHAAYVYQTEANTLNGNNGYNIVVTVQWEEE